VPKAARCDDYLGVHVHAEPCTGKERTRRGRAGDTRADEAGADHTRDAGQGRCAPACHLPGQSAQTDESPPTWCDGLPVETLEEKWPDGKIKSRRQVVRDKEGNAIPHGLTTQMWESGEKKLEITFQCGVKHGPRLAWHRDGKQWSVGQYVNGKDDGTWTEWYADGTKAQEFTLHLGAWVGAHIRWHTNGKKRSEIHYQNGLRQGPLLFWNEEGDLIARVDFVDGVEQPTPDVRQNG